MLFQIFCSRCGCIISSDFDSNSYDCIYFKFLIISFWFVLITILLCVVNMKASEYLCDAPQNLSWLIHYYLCIKQCLLFLKSVAFFYKRLNILYCSLVLSAIHLSSLHLFSVPILLFTAFIPHTLHNYIYIYHISFVISKTFDLES